MIWGRLCNSLQYNLWCKEREWRTTNLVRREYALSNFQKIVLALGRNPVLWGYSFLGNILISIFCNRINRSSTLDSDCCRNFSDSIPKHIYKL